MSRSSASEPDNPTHSTRATEGIPESDDPVVLRELLRQTRKQLALHQSIDTVIADNVARSEALLAEASKARAASPVIDVDALREAVTGIRASLNDALSRVDELESLLNAAEGDSAEQHDAATPTASPTASHQPDTDSPHTTEVLMHQVHAPALARSAQQFLLDVDGVTHAEVRELAEGLLRITVETTTPITGDTFAAWEPHRTRAVRTSNADVLELELDT